MIADGMKTQIAKARPFDLSGPWILISGGRAYGTMEVGLPVPISAEDFDQRFGEHRVRKSDRKKWWFGKDPLYLSPIISFKPFDKCVNIQVEPGAQTVVEKVEFKGDEPESLPEHCEQVRLVIEALEVDTKSEEKAVGVAELPDEAVSLAEVIDEPIIVEDSAGGETVVEPMGVVVPPPYMPNALDMLQSRIHKSFTVVADDLLAWGYVSEQQRIKLSGAIGTALETFIRETEALESEIEGLPSLAEQLRHTGLDDAHALIMASKEEKPMPYDPKNPPAKLRGMPAKAQRVWVHAYNNCKYKDTGRCHKIAYGAVENAGYYQDDEGKWRSRKDFPITDEDFKARWERAYINDLPDSAFLYIEPGGKKDEDGKTVPRKLRHLPYKDASGKIDRGHVKNALSRLGQPKTGEREGERWLTESLRKRLLAKARQILGQESKAESKGIWAWLKERFDGILGDLRGADPVLDPGQRMFVTFKGKDGRPWLLTWTMNAFEDREEEIFRTKAIEEYVARHAKDAVKGEYWFWHLPGAKMADIQWQAVVGRFLVELGPFDDTPIGRKLAAFFSQYPHDHPEIAPEGWGSSHGYYYVPVDREDKIYDWFDKFETTVLPRSAASNQHSPRMEVLPMDDLQRKALAAIGGDDLVELIIRTGEERTKELEQQGIAFKSETAADQQTEEQEAATEAKSEEKQAQQLTETEVKAEETQDAEPAATGEEVKEPDVDSQTKAITELAHQIVAGLNLGEIAQAIKSIQDTVGTIAVSQKEQDERIKALEDIGGEDMSPLIPLPPAAYFQASRLAQTEPEEKMVDKAQPKVPDAIVEMAKLIPV